MKTVQECLRQADREKLLDALAYDTICDPILLLECRDRTITEIQNACKKRMNDLIDHLLTLGPVPSDHMVLYMTEASSHGKQDKTLNLIDLNEIREDIHASSYAFDLTDWKETLGYLVADNKLTQDYMIDGLCQYLEEITFLGMDPEQHQERVKEVYADIDQGMKEIEEGHTVPAEEVFEELRKKHGMPVDEKDKKQKELHSRIIGAEIEYNRYCDWRERSRILQELGEDAPSFEEAERKVNVSSTDQ